MKDLTFSLPWPIRSSPKEYQLPLLVIMSNFTAASRRLALQLIPLPNMISSSTLRKGGATLFFTTFTRTLFPMASSVPLEMVSILLISRRTEA